jgi:hypothetical protein
MKTNESVFYNLAMNLPKIKCDYGICYTDYHCQCRHDSYSLWGALERELCTIQYSIIKLKETAKIQSKQDYILKWF